MRSTKNGPQDNQGWKELLLDHAPEFSIFQAPSSQRPRTKSAWNWDDTGCFDPVRAIPRGFLETVKICENILSAAVSVANQHEFGKKWHETDYCRL